MQGRPPPALLCHPMLTTEQLVHYLTTTRNLTDLTVVARIELGPTTRLTLQHGSETWELAASQPNDLTDLATLQARLQLVKLAADKALTAPVLWADEQPATLPNTLIYAQAAPLGSPLTEAEYLADPLPAATLLRNWHALGANRPFAALKAPSVQHPQLQGIEPITPHSALAWYLINYAEQYPMAGVVAQNLAGLWLQLKAAYLRTPFDLNMLQVTHHALHWSQIIRLPNGRWHLAQLDTALIDDPIADFIWLLAPLPPMQQQQLLSAYGIPSFVHDEWLAHWRLRYIHRLLELAAQAAYLAFVALGAEPLAGFPAGVRPPAECQADYNQRVGQAAEMLGVTSPILQEWT